METRTVLHNQHVTELCTELEDDFCTSIATSLNEAHYPIYAVKTEHTGSMDENKTVKLLTDLLRGVSFKE